MQYDEVFVTPMREELTRHGIEELRTAEEVDTAVSETKGTLMVVINSICGCAAGIARPAVVEALRYDKKPDRIATVFAGQDREATARVRSYITEYPPSSPSIALFKNGTLVGMIERWQIEGREAAAITAHIRQLFDAHCAVPAGD
jgi:putative YphP/YqiW family bacilliredoxin